MCGCKLRWPYTSWLCARQTVYRKAIPVQLCHLCSHAAQHFENLRSHVKAQTMPSRVETD